MNLRTCAVYATAGFLLLACGLSLYPDRRGHTPSVWHDASWVKPLHPRDAPFTVGDCLLGSINRYAAPSDEDVVGSATLTVLTCRSRSSVLTATWLYLLAVSAYPAWRLLKRMHAQ
jgi:hypothetical protein